MIEWIFALDDVLMRGNRVQSVCLRSIGIVDENNPISESMVALGLRVHRIVKVIDRSGQRGRVLSIVGNRR